MMVRRVLGWKAFVPLAVINNHMLQDFLIFLPEITETHHVFTTVRNRFSPVSAFSKIKTSYNYDSQELFLQASGNPGFLFVAAKHPCSHPYRPLNDFDSNNY